MKKLNLVILSGLIASCLAGCGSSKTSSSVSKTSTSQTSAVESSSVYHEPVEITYSAWNLGEAESETPNLDRLLIQEFQKKYPWIKVNILERPKNPGTTDDMKWEEFLAARASVGKLPDVFMVDTIPNYIINNWVSDISSVANADPEYLMLSEDVREAAVYNGMTFALPTAIYYHGYVVNKTLFNDRNLDFPTVDSSWDEFLQLIKDGANHTSGGNGTAGLEGIEHIIHYYPSLVNDKLDWFAFDGEKYCLDGEEFRKAVDFYLSIYNDKSICYNGLESEEVVDFFGEGDAWNDGNMLAKWFGTYSLGSLQANIDNGTWEGRSLDFIGVPSVNGVKKTPISMDFNAVSSQTKHPEEAYLLAKWLGFGKDGYAKRLELSQTVEGLSLVSFAPLIADETLLDSYFKLYPSFKGYRKIIESQSFIVEPVKTKVGYNDVRYQGSYDAEHTMFGIIQEVLDGTTKLADISAQLSRRANEIYADYTKSFDEAINKYYITAK